MSFEGSGVCIVVTVTQLGARPPELMDAAHGCPLQAWCVQCSLEAAPSQKQGRFAGFSA